ncbi:MAG: Lrp/AsnC family transcriptional regulator [Bacteroidota bacterium]
MHQLDTIDIEVLKLLQQDAKLTIKEIAAQLNLSTTPIFDRMKKMEKQGIIDRYVALVNPAKVGQKLFAFVHISLKEHSRSEVEKFIDQVVQFKEVVECYHISGEADFMLKVVLANIEAYNQFALNKLSRVSNIGKVESRFCLSVRKYSTEIPL